jgi:hypothetical protein
MSQAMRGGTDDLNQLRADIRTTRAELGETVEALAAKADVKARVARAADDAGARVRQTARGAVEQVGRTGRRATQPPVSWLLLGVGVLAALAAAVAIWRRR